MAFPNPHNINYAADGSAGTSHSAVMTGVASGDRVLLIVETGLYTTSIPTLSGLPTGWNKVTDFGESGLRAAVIVWELQGATGSETNFNFTTSQSLFYSWTVVCISGAHATESPAIATADNGLVANIDCPNLAPSWGAEDTLWIPVGLKARADNAVTAFPTNYNDNQATHTVSTGSGGHTNAICTRNLNATSDNPGVYTCASTRAAIGLTIGIRPAAAASGRLLKMLQHHGLAL